MAINLWNLRKWYNDTISRDIDIWATGDEARDNMCHWCGTRLLYNPHYTYISDPVSKIKCHIFFPFCSMSHGEKWLKAKRLHHNPKYEAIRQGDRPCNHGDRTIILSFFYPKEGYIICHLCKKKIRRMTEKEIMRQIEWAKEPLEEWQRVLKRSRRLKTKK